MQGISTNYEMKNGAEVLRIGIAHAMMMFNGAIIKPGYRSKIRERLQIPIRKTPELRYLIIANRLSHS